MANRERFPLTVKTDENPPLVKFPARFGVIELNADPAMPVTVRNIEDRISMKLTHVEAIPGKTIHVGGSGAEARIISLMTRLRSREYEPEKSFFSGVDKTQAIALPKPGGKKQFEVRDSLQAAGLACGGNRQPAIGPGAIIEETSLLCPQRGAGYQSRGAF